MKKKIRNFKLPIIGVYKDIINYFDWVNTINNAKRIAESKYNKFNLSHSYFYTLYLIVTLADEDKVLPDPIKRLRVVESLRPINLYLDEELGFAEYLVPEFNQFYDEENNPTLSYGIVYRFSFKTLSLKWIITRTIFLTTFILLFTKFDILNFIKKIYEYFA